MLEMTVKKETLLEGLSKVQTIVEKRSTMPILANVLLETEENKLKMTATDLDITYQGTFAAAIASQGRLTVPARKFHEIVSVWIDEDIHLREVDNFSIKLSGSRSNYQLHGLSADDFPEIPDYLGVACMDIENQALKDMIDKTIYSVTPEETRYNLSGVYMEKLEVEGRKIFRFVSTDGHRLSLVDKDMEKLDDIALENGVIASRKAMSEMKKFTDAAGESLRIGFASKYMLLTGDGNVLVLRLLEGRFPDYKLVVPARSPNHMVVARREFMESLRRMAVMSNERHRGTKFLISPKQLTLIAVNPDFGEANETLPVEFEGEELNMGFNVRYFIECLSAMKSDMIRLVLKDEKSPCLIEGDDDAGFVGVIMPMKI